MPLPLFTLIKFLVIALISLISFVDLDDPEIFFSFIVHHGGGYDGEMENYIRGKLIFSTI